MPGPLDAEVFEVARAHDHTTVERIEALATVAKWLIEKAPPEERADLVRQAIDIIRKAR